MSFWRKARDFVDGHYKTPKGLIGTFIGEKMVRQHKSETDWSLELMDVQKGDRILELGCGAGYAIKLISEKDLAEEVVGLDISPTVIRSACIRNKRAIREKRVTLVQASLHNLPFQNEDFHKIFSIQTIYFWEEIDKTISEIYRVLKKDGIFILTFSDGKEDEIWEGIRELTENQVIPHMMNSGFKDVSLVKGPDSRGYHTVAVTGTKN